MNKEEMARVMMLTPTLRGYGAPLLCIAAPGEGKTTMWTQAAKLFGVPYEILSPGERGEGAFGVICVPVEDDDGKWLVALPPGWVKKFEGQGKGKSLFSDGQARGLLIVDEVTSAPAALQPALLGLINDGRIGEYHFAPGIRIIGLGNPPEQAAYGTPLSAANANRFCWAEWSAPSVEEHAAYMLSVGLHGLEVEKEFDLVAEEANVATQWKKWAWARAVALETGFLKAQPQFKNQCPDVDDPRASGPWPSDRTWEQATRIYAACLIQDVSKATREALVRGYVGPAAAEAFHIYEEKTGANLPDCAALLDGQVAYAKPKDSNDKTRWQHVSHRIDITAAVLAGCAATVIPAKAEKRKARGDAMWGLFDKLIKDGCDKDLIVPAMAAMLTAKPILVGGAARHVLDKMESTLAAAGITWGK